MYLSLLLLFLLIICSGILLFFRYLKLSLLTFITGVALLLLIGMGYLPNLLLNHLEAPFATLTQPKWGEKNAIIILGAGTVITQTHAVEPSFISYSRMLKATELYFSCKKSGNICIIIPSGGDPAHHGKSEAESLQTELLKLNVDPKDMMIEPNSNNTFQNAENIDAILRAHWFDSLILVTSAIHMKRSLLYFSFFDMKPQAARSDEMVAVYSYIPVGYNFALFDFAMHEYIGIARFYIYNFFGWNKKSA